ncbi:MAG: ABC transporter permease [Deltaproteobacteria bacterium]|nr:ABC transporter permease [Deltaproteobacteria bacterium]
MGGAQRKVLFVLVLIVGWAAASRFAHNYLFPGPAEVIEALARVARRGELLRALLKTTARLLAGYSASLVGGVALGVTLARVRTLRDTLGVLVLGLQAIPSVCWMPVALLAFGLNERAIFSVVVLGSMLSVSIATESAVRNVAPIILRAASTMGAKGATLWLRVILPAAMPGIVSGARLGWTFAWRSLMAAELLFVSGGLGQVLEQGRELYDMAQVLGVVLVIVCFGLASEQLLFGRIEDRMRRRWGIER